MGVLVVARSEPEELGNTVRVEFDDGKERAFRGRAMAIPGQIQFDGAALRGSYFISDPDNLRMARRSNMRFINAVTSAEVTISIVNGDDVFSAGFDVTPHLVWVERVAEECDRQIGQ